MIQISPFGTIQGQSVPLITLSNDTMSVELLPYGATVRAIRVPARSGVLTDVCLGYDTLEEYRRQDGCMGGTIGRCANRIRNARFTLNGQEYFLAANEGTSLLHGGEVGFHKRLWRYGCERTGVSFFLDSPNGEEGFPGELHVKVTYSLEGGTLGITYEAVSDRDTVVNLTNHIYFNLAGHAGGEVTDHELYVNAAAYTPVDTDKIPTGEVRPVLTSPFDLREGGVLGERWNSPLIEKAHGYDVNYVLEHDGRSAAGMYCPRTGIAMEVRTTMEGMQLYTAGLLTERRGKNGAVYAPSHAVCFEPQHFPNAVNQANFPSPVLRAGQKYLHKTEYRFFVC